MKVRKIYKVGDIVRWQGIKNSDTGMIEYGYLWICVGKNRNVGKRILGKTRSEAIKNYKIIIE